MFDLYVGYAITKYTSIVIMTHLLERVVLSYMEKKWEIHDF